ncbi:phage tail-collar fiber domain-containing protein [Kluyvera intermedia]|uniref:phage tail-collar fiber domain-containing protein n=1 Tax=Kluyvera intermedia TaxID=61648 RepID=UPI00372CF746
MSQAVITKSFSEWKAQQAVNNKAVVLDEFVFAYIPDLDVNKPISNTETIPAADKIVHRQAVSKCGVVNDNSVVYSITLGADVGDFNFNWIGLTNKATGTLAMIIHAPAQSKVKNASGQQGNVLVRSMLMEYSGAQAATEITTPAETWQIDFTARLAAMDERQRLENVDQYGPAAFFGEGYLVAKSGTKFFVTKGAGYVAGLRTSLAENQNITISTKPVKVWLDVSWSGTLTSAWEVQQKFTVADTLADYEQGGIRHFVFALASIDAAGVITDLRPKGGLSDQALKEHEESRNHPDGTLNAKGFVQLSSATDSDSESQAATPKAVKAANDNADGRVPSTRKVNSKPLSGDITLSADDVVAVPGKIRGSINNGMTMAAADKTGWWQIAVSDTSTVSDFPKKPNGSKLYGYGYMFVWVTGNTWFQHYYAHHGEVAYRQEWTAGPSAAAGWVIEFNTVNKPAAAEVDAVSASGGGTFKGIVHFTSIVRIDKSYPGLVLRDAGTADSVIGKDIILEASGSNVRLLFRKKDITDNQLMLSFPKVTGTLYSTGNKPSAGDVGAYSKSEGDARYQAKGNYTPAGQAYTKAESDARYVQNMQRGAATSPGKANEYGPNEAPTGCVLTRAWHDASTSYGVLFTYRPLQIYINGAWRTITG